MRQMREPLTEQRQHTVIVTRIEKRLSLPAISNQTQGAVKSEPVRNGGLGEFQRFGELRDGTFFLGQKRQDADAHRIGQRLKRMRDAFCCVRFYNIALRRLSGSSDLSILNIYDSTNDGFFSAEFPVPPVLHEHRFTSRRRCGTMIWTRHL